MTINFISRTWEWKKYFFCLILWKSFVTFVFYSLVPNWFLMYVYLRYEKLLYKYEYELLPIQISIKHTCENYLRYNIEIHGIQLWEAWGNIELKMKLLEGDTKSMWLGLVFWQLRPPEVITLFVVDTESPIKMLKWTHSCGDLPFADCILQSWGCSLQSVIMFLWLMIVDFEKVHKHKILFPSSHLA